MLVVFSWGQFLIFLFGGWGQLRLLIFDGFFEAFDAFAESFADFRQASCAEDYQDHQQYQKQFRRPDGAKEKHHLT